MNDLSAAIPASLDDVLSAVKETARGRWFLENYEARLRNEGNERILEAINKLESHVKSIPVGVAGPDADLLKRAREAIAAARRDISALEPTSTGPSNEARLFAHLAEKARSAIGGNAATAQSVSRALQLVNDLDQDLNGKPTAQAAAQENNRFFKQDEAIFEPAPKPVAVAPLPQPSAATADLGAEVSTRGAKLTVHRLRSTILPLPVASPQPAPAEPPASQHAGDAPTEQAKPRIVIIRRKAEDMGEVPLLDPQDASPEPPASAA